MPRTRPPASPQGPQAPRGPQGPDSPDGPRKRSSRFGKRSKTGNIKCSEAASAWQIAIKHGGSPGKEVYKTLAQCRAGNKTAKAGMAAGTAAGAALAGRAVTSRIDRNLATATSRKAELQTRIRERAGRTISDVDRQRANDIASRVSGNSSGPSAGLRRLQGVRAPRTRQTSAPAATPPPAAPARAPRTRRAAASTPAPPPLRTESGIRSDAAALFRNMRATGRGQQARDLSGMARMEIVARDGFSRNLHNNLRRASPLEILNQASRQGITKQPIMGLQPAAPVDRVAKLVARVRASGNHAGNRHDASANRHITQISLSARTGPQAPRVGLEAYHASRALRTQPGVAESRSAAARGLVALRQAGPAGRGDARSVQALGGSGVSQRGTNITSAIVQMRIDAGQRFNSRGYRANEKGYASAGTTGRDLSGAPAIRSTAARELAEVRRFRNASFAAIGQRGPGNYWRTATGATQVANPVVRPNLRAAGGANGTAVSISGQNRPDAVRAYTDRARAGQAARQAAAAPPPPTTTPPRRSPARPAQTRTRRSPAAVQGRSNYTPAQLTEARRQAGTFGDYASQSPHSRAERSAAVARANDLGLNLTGRTADEKFNHLASILGAPPEAARNIRVTVSGDAINIRNEHFNAGSHSRTIHVDTDGTPYVYNDYYIPNDTGRQAGMATDHYNRQILAARAAGISKIRVSGAGRGSGNVDTSSQSTTGYHMWVEYGFDGQFGLHGRDVFRRAHPALANVTENSTFNETIHHPDPVVARAARDAWRREGTGTYRVTLDISDTNSPSMQAYKNLYRNRRNQDWSQSNVSTNASRDGHYGIYR